MCVSMSGCIAATRRLCVDLALIHVHIQGCSNYAFLPYRILRFASDLSTQTCSCICTAEALLQLSLSLSLYPVLSDSCSDHDPCAPVQVGRAGRSRHQDVPAPDRRPRSARRQPAEAAARVEACTAGGAGGAARLRGQAAQESQEAGGRGRVRSYPAGTAAEPLPCSWCEASHAQSLRLGLFPACLSVRCGASKANEPAAHCACSPACSQTVAIKSGVALYAVDLVLGS